MCVRHNTVQNYINRLKLYKIYDFHYSVRYNYNVWQSSFKKLKHASGCRIDGKGVCIDGKGVFYESAKNMAFLSRKATRDDSDKKNFRGKFKKTLEKTRQNKKNVL